MKHVSKIQSPEATTPHANFEQLRQRAQDLATAAAQGRASATWRMTRALGGLAPSRDADGLLAHARKVVALEACFPNWPRLRQALDVEAFERADAESRLVEAALAGDAALADAIVQRWPELPRRSRPCALVLAHPAAAEGWTAEIVNEPLAPNGWPALAYLLNSRLRAGDTEANATRLDIAKALMDRGADANAGVREADTLRGYRTALGAAAGRVRSPALVKLLLDAGADAADGPTLYEGCAMWEAVRWRDVESLKHLLAAGPPQWHVCHALPHALRFNDAGLTELLLANGADPNWNMGIWGFKGNCLHEAVVLGNDAALVRALLDGGANIGQTDRDGRTPLALATCLNRGAHIALLRERGASEDDVRPADRWVAACFAGDAAVARLLAARLADAACFKPADHLWVARVVRAKTANAPPGLEDASPDALRLLLAGGLDPNAADDDGERPLHLAAAAGDAPALAALLAAGADAKALNFEGRTPLDVAIDAGHDSLAEELARNGGDATSRIDDAGFQDAFERAADAVVDGDIDALRELLRHRPRLATARSKRPHRCTLLNYLGANGFEGWRQRTPANAVAVIDLLISAGGDPNAVCYTYRGGPGENTAGLLAGSGHPKEAGLTLAMLSALGRGGARQEPMHELLTALHEAGRQGRLPEAVAREVEAAGETAGLALVESAMLGEETILFALLDAGVDVDARRGDDATALHQAAIDGNAALVEKLLASGADPTLRDNVFHGAAAGWAHAGGHAALGKRLEALLPAR